MPRSCTNTQLLVCCRSVYTRAFMFQAENFKYIEIHAKYTKSKSHTLYWLHITITADKCNLFLLICQWWRDCGSKVGRKKSFALWLLFSGSNARPRFFWRQCQASHFCCCHRFCCRFCHQRCAWPIRDWNFYRKHGDINVLALNEIYSSHLPMI